MASDRGKTVDWKQLATKLRELSYQQARFTEEEDQTCHRIHLAVTKLYGEIQSIILD